MFQVGTCVNNIDFDALSTTFVEIVSIPIVGVRRLSGYVAQVGEGVCLVHGCCCWIYSAGAATVLINTGDLNIIVSIFGFKGQQSEVAAEFLTSVRLEISSASLTVRDGIRQ